MRTLITGDRSMVSPQPADVTIRIKGNRKTFVSYGADIVARKYPNLDPGLQEMVVRCLAVVPNNRPSLEDIVIYLRDKIQRTTSASYRRYPGGGRYETTAEMRRLVKRCIFDANT